MTCLKSVFDVLNDWSEIKQNKKKSRWLNVFFEQHISSQLSVGLIMAFRFSWKIELQSQERNIFCKVKELVKEFQRIN